jgi:hypothetical protein
VDKLEKRLHFSNSVGGVSVDWAVGALLLEVRANDENDCAASFRQKGGMSRLQVKTQWDDGPDPYDLL